MHREDLQKNSASSNLHYAKNDLYWHVLVGAIVTRKHIVVQGHRLCTRQQ
jgi:hypothetical protein